MSATVGARARYVGFALVLTLLVGSAHWQPAQAAAVADTIIYIVQPGDTLYSIGRQYGVSWTDIMQANQLPDTNIYAGQQLMIPLSGSDSAQPSAPEDGATATPAAASSSAVTYTVRRGDSLTSIARQYGVAVADLARTNNLGGASFIYAGQTLVIPGLTAPTPGREASVKKLIVINISEQRMSVYQDGGILWEWVVSTGEPGLDTLPGQYSVLDKIPNAYAATWDLWMPNWLGIYWAGSLENGIHALPILSNGLRLWDGYLGMRVSFGCIILGIQEAQTLYDWADVGTAVNIQQ